VGTRGGYTTVEDFRKIRKIETRHAVLEKENEMTSDLDASDEGRRRRKAPKRQAREDMTCTAGGGKKRGDCKKKQLISRERRGEFFKEGAAGRELIKPPRR